MTVLEITNDIYTTLKEKNVCEEISAENYVGEASSY